MEGLNQTVGLHEGTSVYRWPWIKKSIVGIWFSSTFYELRVLLLRLGFGWPYLFNDERKSHTNNECRLLAMLNVRLYTRVCVLNENSC